MKANIHPDYHEAKIVLTDGTEYTTRTCWGKPGDTMRLDIDPLNHPAWTGGAAKVMEKGRLAKFGAKYAGLGVAAAENANAAAQKTADAKKEKEEAKK
jgi:large subunit ribosomal protein L31